MYWEDQNSEVDAADTEDNEELTDDDLEGDDVATDEIVDMLEKYPELVEKIRGIKTGKDEANKGKKSENKDGDLVMCTMQIDPVCCGDVEYDNDCLAGADGITDVDKDCVRGKCDDSDYSSAVIGMGSKDRYGDEATYGADAEEENEEKLENVIEK